MTLPSDIAAEKALCACVLQQESCFDAVSDQVKPVDFFTSQCRTLWEKYSELRATGRPIDPVTVGHPDLVAKVVMVAPFLANVQTYASTVVALSRARRVITACEELATLGRSGKVPPNTFIDQALGAVFEATKDIGGDTLEHMAGAATTVVTNLDQAMRANTRSGTPSGFDNIDRYTGGWHGSELSIWAARPGKGKSALGLQAALNVAKTGFPVVFFSLEMSKQQLVERALSALSEVDATKLRLASVNLNERERLGKSVQSLEPLPIWIDDRPGLTLLELRAKVRRVQASATKPIKLVVVDYIQLMRGTTDEIRQGREREVGSLAQGLKELAKQMNISVLALAQLNRDVEHRGENAVPRLSDLRESGNLEQAADNIAFLFETPDPTQVAVPMTWLLEKQRSGPTGEALFLFDKRFTRFSER